jgi:hypothetical protein
MVVLAERVHRRELQDLLTRLRSTEVFGKRNLICRIVLNGPYSVNGTDERHTRAFDTTPARISTCS